MENAEIMELSELCIFFPAFRNIFCFSYNLCFQKAAELEVSQALVYLFPVLRGGRKNPIYDAKQF